MTTIIIIGAVYMKFNCGHVGLFAFHDVARSDHYFYNILLKTVACGCTSFNTFGAFFGELSKRNSSSHLELQCTYL